MGAWPETGVGSVCGEARHTQRWRDLPPSGMQEGQRSVEVVWYNNITGGVHSGASQRREGGGVSRNKVALLTKGIPAETSTAWTVSWEVDQGRRNQPG